MVGTDDTLPITRDRVSFRSLWSRPRPHNPRHPPVARPTRSEIPLPTSTPAAIATIVSSALRKSPSPAAASAPTISVTPSSPSAPGTSSQNAGRNVTGTGGPVGRCWMAYATGSTTTPAANDAPSGFNTSPAPACTPYATPSTASSQGSERVGTADDKNTPSPNTATPTHGAHAPSGASAAGGPGNPANSTPSAMPNVSSSSRSSP